VAVQLPSFSIISAHILKTHSAMNSLRVDNALTEIGHLRNKLGGDVNIITVVCHSCNSALLRGHLHWSALRRSHKNRS
jgi:predicted lysophospholipase L1 biosynthesis ABC-type transport system permease subunit